MVDKRFLRNVIEREGLGSHVWGERDCITLVRAVIQAISGKRSRFGPKRNIKGPTEERTTAKARKVYGSVRNAWVENLNRDPSLEPVAEGVLPEPGMIGLTADQCQINGLSHDGVLGGVIGPERCLWVKSQFGLGRAGPVVQLWRIKTKKEGA